MLMFTFAISCLTTSNLPWFMDLTFQVPMQYCSLQHWISLLSPVTSTAGYCFCFGSIPSFFLELFLHWSLVAYWAPNDLGSSSFGILSFLPFHTVHGVLKARMLKWLAIPFSSGPHSVRPLHHDPPVLICPVGMAWFHWLRQGCGPSVIRLTSFLQVWFQCVCPLMPSCHSYHLTWVSLTLGVGYLLMAAPAKHSRCSLPWRRGISLLPPFLTFNYCGQESLRRNGIAVMVNKRVQMQYLDAISKMTEWSLLVFKANHSILQ